MLKAFNKETAVAHGTVDGIEWQTRRAPLYGAVNGYARLPEGHPWRYEDLQLGTVDINVHWGVTYGPDKNGWIGFDTLHAGDYWPGMPDLFSIHNAGIVWDIDMVAAEAMSLAKQISRAENIKGDYKENDGTGQ